MLIKLIISFKGIPLQQGSRQANFSKVIRSVRTFKGIPLQQGSRQHRMRLQYTAEATFKGIPLQQGSRPEVLFASSSGFFAHLKVFHYNKDQDLLLSDI